jgi:predicted polyphosphate/ATP-dependent NAD kinase
MLRRIGLIINPIAGMGGAVGLKGTDGKEIVKRARALGAEKISAERAKAFLSSFGALSNTIEFLTCPGEMGERVFQELKILCKVIPGRIGETSAEDTKLAAKFMQSSDVAILAFCGGDGTARDILDAVGQRVPVIGIPSGVKMHSGVFAVSPKAAAEIVTKFLWDELPLKEAEVADVDEEAFRDGRLSARLYGYLTVPYEPTAIQGMKAPTPLTDEADENRRAIAKWVVENMKGGVLYILGPGSTVKMVNEILNIEEMLLGVDLVLNKKMLHSDVGEKEILEAISKRPARIIVSPIGKQGFIFGRGNQQISSRVLRRVGKEAVMIVSTREKLKGIQVLRVDTGDPDVDALFSVTMRVLVDYGMFRIMRVES